LAIDRRIIPQKGFVIGLRNWGENSLGSAHHFHQPATHRQPLVKDPSLPVPIRLVVAELLPGLGGWVVFAQDIGGL
jgi:hypothetical protein